MSYKIELADGTIIDNLGINGNNYISDTELDVSIFEDNCSPMTITNNDDGSSITYKHGQLIQQRFYNAKLVGEASQGYYLAFREIPAGEVRMRELEQQNQLLTDALLELGDQIYS